MDDGKRTLSADEVSAAGLDDWRQLRDVLRARYRMPDYVTGLAFVARVGQAAEDAGHHPDLTLTYAEVILTLTSHDVGGLTVRDLDLARRVSAIAAEVGATADVTGLTMLDIGLDTVNGERHAPLYAALLGGRVRRGEPVDPSGQTPTLWWQDPSDGVPEEEGGLPPSSVAQRWHFDVWVPQDQAELRLRDVLTHGGTLVSDAAAPSYWVIADADGNRSCICTAADR